MLHHRIVKEGIIFTVFTMNSFTRKFSQSLFYYSVLAFALIVPVVPRTTGILVFFIVISWLMDGMLLKKFQSLISNRTAIRFTALYFFYLIGMIFTINRQNGWNILLLKITMLLFPIIFFTPGNLQLPKRKLVLQIFIVGCAVSSVVMLLAAAIKYFTSGKQQFSYSDLTALLHLHPGVFSCYLLFAFFALMIPMFQNTETLFPRGIGSGMLIFFVAMIFLLSAREEILMLLLLSVGFVFYHFIKQKKIVLASSLSLLLAIVLTGALFLFPSARMRLASMEEQFHQNYSNTDANSVTVRKVIWQSSYELIKANPVMGYGTGDVNDELKKKYSEKNLQVPFEKSLNAHNQYLQRSVAVRIPGLLMLLVLFLSGIQIAVRGRDELYFIFIFIFILANITECIFEEEMGLVFFTFFNTLLAVESVKRPLAKTIAV